FTTQAVVHCRALFRSFAGRRQWLARSLRPSFLCVLQDCRVHHLRGQPGGIGVRQPLGSFRWYSGRLPGWTTSGAKGGRRSGIDVRALRVIADWKSSIVRCCFVLLVSARPAVGCVSDGQYVMGTVLEITLCDNDATQEQQAITALFAAATHLDEI